MLRSVLNVAEKLRKEIGWLENVVFFQCALQRKAMLLVTILFHFTAKNCGYIELYKEMKKKKI